MLTHFFATNPEFLPAFFFGILTAFGAGLWKSAKGSCLLVPLYLYIFGAWCLLMTIYLLTNPTTAQAGFALGFLLPSFGKLKDSFSSLLDRIQDHIREQHYRRESEKWDRENQHRQQQEQAQQQQAKQEQARREQEARQYREQQERAKREQAKAKQRQDEQRQQEQAHQHHNQQRETPKDPAPPSQAPDTRTYAEILGLQAGYTEEDLKQAKKRELQKSHPDKWIHSPPHIKQAMEEENKKVNEAFTKLMKPFLEERRRKEREA